MKWTFEFGRFVRGLAQSALQGNQSSFHATMNLPKTYARHAIDVQLTMVEAIVEQMIFIRSLSHC